jgi:SAM-dependent methyltransferase
MRTSGNPFEKVDLAGSYEGWYHTVGRRAARLEKRLLGRLLVGLGPLRSVIEVGCGTGHFTRWVEIAAAWAFGVDLSLSMLAQARRHGSRRLVAGDAHTLPLPDASCDAALLVTTLEFVDRPAAVLREAARVARRGLVIGALNRHSLLGLRLARRAEPPWTSARLLTVAELERLATEAAPTPRPVVRWRTTLWPAGSCEARLPWGDFVGVSVRWSQTGRS